MTAPSGSSCRWADAVRRLQVRANADTPRDARVARDFGAEGIGLCRTEHMFFAEDRIPIMQEMILAADERGARERRWNSSSRCSGRISRGCTGR